MRWEVTLLLKMEATQSSENSNHLPLLRAVIINVTAVNIRAH
jgi:hypothetical protein